MIRDSNQHFRSLLQSELYSYLSPEATHVRGSHCSMGEEVEDRLLDAWESREQNLSMHPSTTQKGPIII